MSKYKYNFSGSGSSDDCGSLDGAHHENGEYLDESEACHNWFELKVDGEVIGEAMMSYDGGWSFMFRSNTHEMEAGKLLCPWDETP
jgi:hypothetical protein